MTVRDLGELGQTADAPTREDLKFTYFGAPIRVNPLLSDLVVLDLMDRAANMVIPDEDDEPDAEQMKAANGLITGFLRRAVHPEDFPVLWEKALENGQGIAELMQLSMTLVGAVSERPTKKPNASRGGRRRTQPKSVRGSSSRVVKSLEAQGRGDKAVMVLMADQARSAASA